MVSDRKLFITPLARYRLGTALLWLGVLIWVPYIFLRVTGQSPAVIWFLIVHLLGVVGGSRMRAYARKEMGMITKKRNLWHVFGHMLIWFGVAVWVPYFYSRLIAGMQVQVMNYLPYHLIGVIGGVLMLIVGSFVSRRNEANI